mmetsp:Transcript_31958/g.39182  ORF Transcript_31958/g.39182 Transcript_31958/m.39182 type:complete len:958 (-) Transcript_31958:175-3048(-)
MTSVWQRRLQKKKKQDEEKAKETERLRREQVEKERIAAEEKAKEQERRRVMKLEMDRRRKQMEMRQEQLRKESEEKERLQQLAQQKAEEKKREQLRRIAQQKEEMEAKRRAVEAARKEKEEEEERQRRAAVEEAARLAQQQREEEERRQRERHLLELQKKQREEEEKERQRQLELMERDRQKRIREEEQRRAAAQKAALEKDKREKEEQEWERKMNDATKIFLWKKWRHKMMQRRYHYHHLPSRYDTTMARGVVLPSKQRQLVTELAANKDRRRRHPNRREDAATTDGVSTLRVSGFHQQSQQQTSNLWYLFECLKRNKTSNTSFTTPLNLSLVIRNEITKYQEENVVKQQQPHNTVVLLCKVAIVLPPPSDNNPYNDVMVSWLNSQLPCGRIVIVNAHGGNDVEVRTVIVATDDHRVYCDADVALFVLDDSTLTTTREEQDARCFLREDIPQWVLLLRTSNDGIGKIKDMNKCGAISIAIDTLVRQGRVWNVIARPENTLVINERLRAACETLVREFVKECHYFEDELNHGVGSNNQMLFLYWGVERYSLASVARRVLRMTLLVLKTKTATMRMKFPRNKTKTENNDTDNYVMTVIRQVLLLLVNELKELGQRVRDSPIGHWPPVEFTGVVKRRHCDDSDHYFKQRLVPLYFSDEGSLPRLWYHTLDDTELRRDIETIFPFGIMEEEESANNFDNIVKTMLVGASHSLVYRCEVMWANKLYLDLWECMLLWQEEVEDNCGCFGDDLTLMADEMHEHHYVYLPRDELNGVVARVIENQFGKNASSQIWNVGYYFDEEASVSAAGDTEDGIDVVDEHVMKDSLIPPEGEASSRAHLCDNTIPMITSTPPHAPSAKRRVVISDVSDNDECNYHSDNEEMHYQNTSVSESNTPSQHNKRARMISKELEDSQRYTRQLEALLRGDETVNIALGNHNNTLADILGESSVDIQVPDGMEMYFK